MRTFEAKICRSCGIRRGVLAGEKDRPANTLREWVVSEIDLVSRCDPGPAIHGRKGALIEVLWQIDRRDGVDNLGEVNHLRRMNCCQHEDWG